MNMVSAAACGLVLWAGAAVAQTGMPSSRPLVVELFTSQGCSSCPPADAIVAGLAQTRPDLLPLTFHVTYWNRLGWEDPFSFEAATQRQRRYVGLGVSPNVYTPAMVIDGVQDVVGSDADAVAGALAQATARRLASVQIEIARSGREIAVSVGAGYGQGTVLLVGFDRQHRTLVARGENGGRTLIQANVVRSVATIGTWMGQEVQLRAPAPEGEELAVLVQGDDGRILGALRLGPAPRS